MTAITLVKELLLAEQCNKSCVFCTKVEDNELLFGKFLTKGLDQKGTVDEGILGFLISDIQKESKRGSKLNCFECKKKGATVGCCNKKCKRTYHFPCGSQTRMLNQYMGAFESFCIIHHPVQKVPAEPFLSDQMAACTICHEAVTAKASYDVLWAPCCMKQAWFHRDCTQKLALSAGNYFRCPMCFNKGIFVLEMKQMGYVPNQDSSWELEPNAFHELCERHHSCDHPTCVCPEGSNHDDPEVGMPWDLILCNSCGSKGLHLGCGKLEPDISEWDCEDCSKIAGKSSIQILQNLSNNCLETSSSSGTGSCSTTLNLSPVALKRRHPVEEGSFSDDDDSDIEIIAIVSASSSSAPPFRCYSSLSCTANGSQRSQRGKVHIGKETSVHSSCFSAINTPSEIASCFTGPCAAAASNSHANQDSFVGEMNQSNHPDIKVEKDDVPLNPDSAEGNHQQERLQRQVPRNNEKDDDGFQQVVEVAKLSYREFTIKIFTDATSDKTKNPPRFFFEPIVVLDPNSIVIQSQEFFQQFVVRFSIQMWNAEIRSKVVELVRHEQPELKERDVSIMPYEYVQLVGKPGSIHHSIKVMDEATSYHRLNEKLEFFLVCESLSTANVLADNLRRYPEFVVRKWQLALECRGLSLNLSEVEGNASPIKRPFYKLDVSTFSVVDEVAKEFQSGGYIGLANIPLPSHSRGVMNGPVSFSQQQPTPPISGGSSTASSATPVIQQSEKYQGEPNRRRQQKKSCNGSSANKRTTEPIYPQTSGVENRESTPPTMYFPHMLTSLPPRPSVPGSAPLAGFTPQQLGLIWKNPNNFASHHPAAMAIPHEALFLADEKRERERNRVRREVKEQREREQRNQMEKQKVASTEFERETQALRQAVQQHYQESLPRYKQQLDKKDTTPSSSSSPKTVLMPASQQKSGNGQHLPSITTLSESNPGATAVPVFSVVEMYECCITDEESVTLF